MPAPCPDENDLLDLVGGSAPCEHVAGHVAQCRDCRDLLGLALGWSPDPRERRLSPGARLGRHVIDAEIGRGAAGRVYRARDVLLDRDVAIKTLHLGSEEMRARLLREARLIAQIEHPNVISIFDVDDRDGKLFLAMELVRGRSVRERMAAGASHGDLLSWWLQAGHGLAEAHRAGIIHRDVKPANVLVGDDGRAVVVDFGLAAERDGAPAELVGTPAYMAPEQIDGLASDPRSDQYSYCASLFHALTGELPFAGDTLADVRRAMNRPIAESRLTSVPGPVRRAILRGLLVAPADRFPSMDALLACLQPRRRTLHTVAGIGGVAAVTAIVALGLASLRESDPCRRDADRISAVWTDSARQRLRERLSRTVPPAEVAAILTGFDGYASRWRDRRVEVCRRASSADPAGDARDDRAALCLASALVDLAATADALTAFDGVRGWMAHAALAALPSIEDCAAGGDGVVLTAPRTERAATLRGQLAAVGAIADRGGVSLWVLARENASGSSLYRVDLPSRASRNRVSIEGGPPWELVTLDGISAYAIDREADDLLSLDLATGRTLARVHLDADMLKNGRGLALDPRGRLVGLFGGRQFRAIDPATGATTLISELDTGYELEAMTFCPDGSLHAAGCPRGRSPAGRQLYRIDLDRGVIDVVGDIGTTRIDVDTMTCDDRGTLYGVDTIDGATNQLFVIDPRTATRSLLGNLPGAVDGLAFAPNRAPR